MAGFVEFFYNIIPGGLFLLVIFATFHKFSSDLLQNITVAGDLTKLSIFFIVSLFLGFVFQMFNKFLPPIKNLHKKALAEIAKKNDFQEAKTRLDEVTGRKNVYKKKEQAGKYDDIEVIYFMHDFLLANRQINILELFHTRISLWANTSIGSIIYAFILLVASLSPFVSPDDSNLYILLFLISTIISICCYFATMESHKNFYDTLLKTFLVSTRKFKIVA